MRYNEIVRQLKRISSNQKLAIDFRTGFKFLEVGLFVKIEKVNDIKEIDKNLNCFQKMSFIKLICLKVGLELRLKENREFY